MAPNAGSENLFVSLQAEVGGGRAAPYSYSLGEGIPRTYGELQPLLPDMKVDSLDLSRLQEKYPRNVTVNKAIDDPTNPSLG